MSTIPHYNLLQLNISDTIPVVPAALPFFIILRAFKISSLLISSQGPSTFSQVVALSHAFSSFSSFPHILSPFFLHLIIFYQHFSICIFHTIYSYYILPGFCHFLCNPVDILLSCCTLQLINKLLPFALSFPVQEQHFLHFRLASLYLFRSLAVLVLCHIL